VQLLDYSHGLARYAKPGAWNDLDMLEGEAGGAGALRGVCATTHMQLEQVLAWAPLCGLKEYVLSTRIIFSSMIVLFSPLQLASAS